MTEIELMQKIGSNLKNMLKECIMTQKELAKYSGIDKSTISRYVNGELMPSVKNLINICDVLDCELDELIDVIKHIE